MFLLLLACLFSMTGFSAKAAVNTSIWLPVKQIFEASGTAVPEEQQVFEYSLVPLETGNPMPEGSSEKEYTLTLTGDQEAKIQIDYSRTGVYSYHFRQVVDEPKDGYLYDDEQYTITVYVKHNTQGELISEVSVAKRTNGMKVAALEFINSYDAASFAETDDPNEANPSDYDAQGAAEEAAGIVDNAASNQPGEDEEAVGLQEDEGEDLEQLGSEAIPRGLRNTDAWALWNLIFAAVTFVCSIILFITYLKKRTESQENENSEEAEKKKLCKPARICSLIVSIASVVFFILTEDVRLPMKWADQYTWIMAVGFLVQVVDILYIRKKGKEEN